jgi:hypothetical protein
MLAVTKKIKNTTLALPLAQKKVSFSIKLAQDSKENWQTELTNWTVTKCAQPHICYYF